MNLSSLRVAVVTAEPGSATTLRLRAELQGLELDVVVVVRTEGSAVGRAPLEGIATEAGAFAAIRVVPYASFAEVWIADRVTGKTVVREILTGKGSPGTSDDLLSLGAVELLRASLMEATASRPSHGRAKAALYPSCPPRSRACKGPRS